MEKNFWILGGFLMASEMWFCGLVGMKILDSISVAILGGVWGVTSSDFCRVASKCCQIGTFTWFGTTSETIVQEEKGGVWNGGGWDRQISGPETYFSGPEISRKIPCFAG